MKWGGEDSPSCTVSHPSYKGGTGPVPCPAYFTPLLLEDFDRVVYTVVGEDVPAHSPPALRV